ncbi:MAG: PilT/PilU family type 4a pilus ATPase [Candidatus Omnitrophica bacterium]|nr:PilT/PilU family type 4a pilus ATPase [Candidatus Omnitrophota bacterium]
MNKEDFLAILHKGTELEASDVHLSANKPPIFRLYGNLQYSKQASISNSQLKSMLYDLLLPEQIAKFEEEKELDFSYREMAEYQFRINAGLDRGNIAITARITPAKIKSLEELNLPKVVQDIAYERKGLVLIAGVAGCGKSTTLTYLIDLINRNRQCKIVTIEDPIEYIHESNKSLIMQREVGADTHTFADAIKHALRQDPDVIVIGEMRDLESMSMAITAAETGHLVLTTVHAPNATETINRIIDVFPQANRDQINIQLAENFLAVMAQMLIPRADSKERILATEVIYTNIAIRNLLRRGSLVELRGQIDADENPKVQSFEVCLSKLYLKNLITKETAIDYSKFPEKLKFTNPNDFKSVFGTKKKTKDKKSSKYEPDEMNTFEKALIIEQDEDDRGKMGEICKHEGIPTIYLAPSGEQGLIIANKVKPDLIIIDMLIVDIDLEKLCEHFKEIVGDGIKIIMITGRFRPEDPQKVSDLGAIDLVVKTADLRLLSKSLQKLQGTYNPENK